MTAWAALMLAGAMEIIWALGLKYSAGLTRLWPSIMTLTAIVLSFAFMSVSLKSIPFGTAYAVWAGIGAAGTAVIGMLVFGEAVDTPRLICLLLIIVGVVGLKLVTP